MDSEGRESAWLMRVRIYQDGEVIFTSPPMAITANFGMMIMQASRR
jgi:hypothetical protein